MRQSVSSARVRSAAWASPLVKPSMSTAGTSSFLLFGLTILIASLGLFLLYESSSYNALIQIGDTYHFVKYQALWLVGGVAVSILISRIHYKHFYPAALPLLLFTIFLLILVFIPGVGLSLKGAHRWVDLRFLVFQPSELLKVTLTLYLAAWLSEREEGRLFAFLILFFTCVLLIALQPDMGTAGIVSITSLLLYFLSGTRLREIVLLFFLLATLGFLLIKIEPYRVARFVAFQQLDEKNILSASYHLRQIIIALGSGGLTGVGFGKSIQKYAYLPESSTDSIFPILAEEAGFIGSFLLIVLFLVQYGLGFLIGITTKDFFGKLLAFGITLFLMVQTLVNLASQVVLIPLTGVPLPFVSYGGSSMVINFIAVGMLLSVARHSGSHR